MDGRTDRRTDRRRDGWTDADDHNTLRPNWPRGKNRELKTKKLHVHNEFEIMLHYLKNVQMPDLLCVLILWCMYISSLHYNIVTLVQLH